MKSSRDIPPRVGMQFYAEFDDDDPRRRIIALCGGSIITDVDGDYPGGTASQLVWDAGGYAIEWIPPSDDERRRFMDVAANQRAQVDAKVHACGGMCDALDEAGGELNFFVRAAIAESLALDGADYDNMPDFEELER